MAAVRVLMWLLLLLLMKNKMIMTMLLAAAQVRVMNLTAIRVIIQQPPKHIHSGILYSDNGKKKALKQTFVIFHTQRI